MKIPGFFLCLLNIFFSSSMALAECGSASGEFVQVARASDGDTLRLRDGRSVRVLGINAPEITHGKKRGQSLGPESHAAVQVFVDASKGKVRLGFEQETRDHYGRLLAHVYDSRGRSLAATQVRLGMAMQIAVPPNTAQSGCLSRLESAARKKAVGVWRDSYWQPAPAGSLNTSETGFRLVRGRIANVNVNSAAWLELQGNLVVRVAKKDWTSFGYQRLDWLALKGKSVELRGWIYTQKSRRSQQIKPLAMSLRSPASMQFIAN